MCRLRQELVVDKILEMCQAMDLQGYSKIILDFLGRDWIKKVLLPGEMMTRMGITSLLLEII